MVGANLKVPVDIEHVHAMQQALSEYSDFLGRHATLLEAAQAAVDVGPGCDGVCPPKCKHEEAVNDLAKLAEAQR